MCAWRIHVWCVSCRLRRFKATVPAEASPVPVAALRPAGPRRHGRPHGPPGSPGPASGGIRAHEPAAGQPVRPVRQGGPARRPVAAGLGRGAGAVRRRGMAGRGRRGRVAGGQPRAGARRPAGPCRRGADEPDCRQPAAGRGGLAGPERAHAEGRRARHAAAQRPGSAGPPGRGARPLPGQRGVRAGRQRPRGGARDAGHSGPGAGPVPPTVLPAGDARRGERVSRARHEFAGPRAVLRRAALRGAIRPRA